MARYPSTPKRPKLRNGRLEVEFREERLKRNARNKRREERGSGDRRKRI